MKESDVIVFAEKVSTLGPEACGDIVHSLMLARSLSKVVRGLDKLAGYDKHKRLAQQALKNLGFDS